VTASEVESRLETNFTLAHRWGCVLLLDEADIFLAERTKDDFLRNSLVSGLKPDISGLDSKTYLRCSISSRIGILLWNSVPHHKQSWRL
jgi:hypothetical protein